MSENVSIIDWLDKHEGECGIFAPPMDAQTAVNFLSHYLLGDDCYISYPCNTQQANTEVVCAILYKYSKRCRKEIRAARKAGRVKI